MGDVYGRKPRNHRKRKIGFFSRDLSKWAIEQKLPESRQFLKDEQLKEFEEVPGCFEKKMRDIVIEIEKCYREKSEALILNDRFLCSLPDECIKKLSWLKTLSLNDNQFTDIPGCLSSLKCLENLHLNSNKISEPTVLSLAENKQLKKVDMLDNPFNNIVSRRDLGLNETVTFMAPKSHEIEARYDRTLMQYYFKEKLAARITSAPPSTAL